MVKFVNSQNMNAYGILRMNVQERDGEKDRKPGGKTRVKEIRKVWD